jgi:hypothetical protein
MLQAHSLLWHYLWVAPNVLLLLLAGLLWRPQFRKQYPIFLAFAVIGGIEQLTLYAADVMPWVSPGTWWLIFWSALVVEGLLKFALIGEIFARIFDSYASVARLGKLLIRGVGVVLVLAAAIAAAFAPQDSAFGIVSGAHLLEQTIYFIESGLLVFIFAFSKYFQLTAPRPIFGIALGLGVSACVHLGTWAVLANGGLPPEKRSVFDLVNMATFHVCVLIWFYYLFISKSTTSPNLTLPGPPAVVSSREDLALWNRELERLLQ